MKQSIHLKADAKGLEKEAAKVAFENQQPLLDYLISIQNVLDRYGIIALVMLLAFLTAWAFAASRAKLLWFDELLGLSIANASSLGGAVSQLKAGVDNSAPLYSLLDHLVIQFFGPSAIAARLPAFLGYCVLVVTLYLFVARRLSRLYGLVAALLSLCTGARSYAWEGRPYGLVLGFAGAALLMYQLTTERRRPAALIAYALCCGALVATHYIAILVVGAFLSGEVVRFLETKRVDWAVLTATIVPPVIVLIFLRSLIIAQLSHMENRGHTSLLAFTSVYDRFKFDSWAVAIAIGLVAWGAWLERNAPPEVINVKPKMHNHELAAAGTLLLLPVIGAIISRYITRAYIPRYFISEIIGLIILVCYSVAAVSKRCIVAPLMIILASSVLLLKSGGYTILLSPVANAPSIAEVSDPPLPVLFESALDFLQVYEYYPTKRQQLWYAAEPSTALRTRGYAGDDIQMVALAQTRPMMQVTTLQNVIRKAPRLVVVPSGDSNVGWVTKCLIAQGVDVKIAHPVRGPTYVFEINSSELAPVDTKACRATQALIQPTNDAAAQ